MDYKPVDKANADELERMRKLSESWELAGPAYVGPTHDLDLTQVWYCPECSDHPKLEVGRYGDSIHCPTHYEICEYTFDNLSSRIRHRAWWGKRFKYPLTERELTEVTIKDKEALIKCCKQRIINAKKTIKETELELIELKASLL